MQFVKPVLNEISKTDECKTHKLNNQIQILPKAQSLHWLISLLHIKVALPIQRDIRAFQYLISSGSLKRKR